MHKRYTLCAFIFLSLGFMQSIVCMEGSSRSSEESSQSSANPDSDILYERLGVSENASESEIRQAYHNLSRQYHPDKNPTAADEAKQKKLNEAYEILGNEDKRKKYDLAFFAEPIDRENGPAGQTFIPSGKAFFKIAVNNTIMYPVVVITHSIGQEIKGWAWRRLKALYNKTFNRKRHAIDTDLMKWKIQLNLVKSQKKELIAELKQYKTENKLGLKSNAALKRDVKVTLVNLYAVRKAESDALNAISFLKQALVGWL